MTDPQATPARTLTQARRGGRPNKARLARLKVAAIVMSAAAFLGSLGGIVLANPAIKSQPAAGAGPQTQFVLPAAPVAPQINAAPLTLPAQSSAPLFMPRTRTRGS